MTARPEPIAVVGIGCRYADVRGPAEFYEIVRSRRNTVRDAPQHRIELGYDIDHFYDPRPRIPGKISSRKGGFLEHPELFDPEAFGIAPRDALTMEPQQRLMIEVTWDALEDAGIPPESILGERVAVILGYMAEDYSRERAGVLGEAAVFRGHDVFTVGGMSHAVLSGRISFLLGVTGPSLTLDTACSSSLYAAHLACESLRRGESKLAITGGANLFLSPEGNIALSRSGMLSMSGACKAFDAGADGFVRAEGAGVVVLRPLSDAIAAGNPIYAVIRGSGISADGRDGGHMMAPGRKGQAQAMRDAYAMAGVSPADVHYVETHGTGTMIGDPVEIGALADVMGPGRSPERPLRVASIKGNLGHTESASGVAGLINACLAIRHRTLPPQLHFETPNPMIPWAEIPIVVQRELEAWPYPDPPLVGLNSFGISGTNAHFVLEAPPEPAPALRDRAPAAAVARTAAAVAAAPARRPFLLPITAHDPNALHAMAEQIRALLGRRPDLDLGDLAYTLARRRSLRAHRLCLVASDVGEACEALDAYLAGEASPRVRTGVAGAAGGAKLVMVFPGQGSQWLGMGRQLLENEPVFAEAIDALDAAYRTQVEWSLRAVLEGCWAFEGGVDAEWTRRLDVLQPVLVAVEVALARLWQHYGIEPDRVLGQSMGEIAAAHVAGALSLDELARIACQRGLVVAQASGRGAMAVVALGREAVQQRLADWPGRVEIAGANSPSTTILSGDGAAVAAMVEALEAEGVFARRLEVDFASHCFHMDPLIEPFRRAIGRVEARAGAIPFDSTVDGETKPGEALDADYWLRNLREAVAFDRGLGAALEAGGEVFLEVSPHPTLPRAIDETAQTLGHAPRYVCSIRRAEDEQASMLVSLAELFVRGRRIDWAALHPAGRVVDLPLYAYQRKRYFFSERSRLDTFRPTHPLLGPRTDSSLDPRLHSWDFPLDADSGSLLDARRAMDRAGAPVVVQAAASLGVELALAAADALWPGRATRVAELVHTRPIELASGKRRTIQVVVREDGRAGGELRISSRAAVGEEWLLHATARLVPAASATATPGPTVVAAATTALLDREGNEGLSIDDYYAALDRCGVGPGAKGRVLRELERIPAGEGAVETAPRAVVGKLMLPRSIESEWYAYHAHPLLLDAAFQLTGALFGSTAAVRVHSVDSIEVSGGIGSDCLCRAVCRQDAVETSGGGRAMVADLELFDRKGAAIARIGGLRLEALPARQGAASGGASEWHRIEWVAAELALLEAKREVDRFILVSDSESNAAWLAAELNKHGVETRFCEKIEDLEPLVRILRANGDGRFGFLLLAWGDSSADASPEPAFQRDFRVGQWAIAIREHVSDAAQIWIATRGLQPREDESGAAAPLAPHVAREIDTFASCAEMQQCRLFDARSTLGDADFAWLAALVGRSGLERQFRMASEGAQVPRLVPLDDAIAGIASSAAGGRATQRAIAGERNFRAVRTGLEGRAAVALVACGERALAPDEVRVEVRAASLTSFDVLAGLGLALGRRGDGVAQANRAGESVGLGLDFAGIVLEIGSRVADLAIGDRVVGIAGVAGIAREGGAGGGAVARRIVLPRRRVAGLPDRLDFISAASLAWPGLVARHVLVDVARVRAGEKVLVVSAGGGVGLSLVERARALGAEVHATACTPARRATLAEQGAVLHDEADASDPDSGFGIGVPGAGAACDEPARFDVIIGSESGPVVHARIAALAPGGRYVDLCPRERFEREELGALRLGANRAVLAVDALSALEADGRGIGSRLVEMMAELAEGTLETIAFELFPVAEASRALRFMTQNRHTGRVVLDLSGAQSVTVEAEPVAAASCFADREVVVSSDARSGRAEAMRSALAEALRAGGAAEVVEPADGHVAAEATLRAMGVPAAADADAREGERLASDLWIHIADEAIDGPDLFRLRLADDRGPERVLVSLRGEVLGEVDRDRAWEARLWVDRLLLAGCSNGSGGSTARVTALSVPADTPPDSVVRVLEDIDRGDGGREQWIRLPITEQIVRAERAPSPLLSQLDVSGRRAGATTFDRAGFLALTLPERRAALLRHVREELAGVLGLGAERRDELDPALRLDALGLDSLMTMELFMGLGRGLELPLAADWFPPGPTLAEIAQVLVRRLEATLAKGTA